MPRQARLDYSGALHHVIGRGIEGLHIFRTKQAKQEFLNRLKSLLKENDLQVYAWSLMSNHFHFLLQTGKTPLSEFMRKLLTGYALYYNRRHRRRGYVFQGRYKSILCERDEYLLPLIRYIHLNPVKAKIITFSELRKYPWTGHQEILREQSGGLINKDEVLGYFGTKRNQAQKSYEGFVKDGLSVKEDFLGGGLIRSLGGLREALRVNKEDRPSCDERILGSGEFVERVLEETEQIDERQRIFKNIDDLFNRVARLYGVSREDILYSRTKSVREARCAVVFLANQCLDYSAAEVGGMLKMKQAASSIAKRKGQQIVEGKGLLRKLMN